MEWGILTGTRYQEIAGARRSEIDESLRRWTIPADRMKLGKSHVVPLSDATLALYRSLPIDRQSDLLFPSLEGGELSNGAMGALIDFMHEERMNADQRGYLDAVSGRIATQHGFRSTFRDWAAEISHFPREIIEHALAHELEDEAEAAYQRGDLLLKRATLMQAWARFCNEPEFKAPLALGQSGQGAATAEVQ